MMPTRSSGIRKHSPPDYSSRLACRLAALLTSANDSAALPISALQALLDAEISPSLIPVNMSTLKEDAVIGAFGLIHPFDFASFADRHWDLADACPSIKVDVSPCLKRFLNTYSQNFQRTSESLCRTAVDVMLNEALILLKGQDSRPPPTSSTSSTSTRPRQNTPLKYDRLAVFAEFSLSYFNPATETTYTGRIDYSIGFIPHHTPALPKRPFYSCLLVVEAKRQGDVDSARGQLLAYMACVQAHRRASSRPDATVYGVATDGYQYEFLTIDPQQRYRCSERVNIAFGGTTKVKQVLGVVVFILEETFKNLTPLPSPENKQPTEKEVAVGGGGGGINCPTDEVLDIDDVVYNKNMDED